MKNHKIYGLKIPSFVKFSGVLEKLEELDIRQIGKKAPKEIKEKTR